MPLFPREHGAYGQMAFPLVTALAVAGVTTPALLVALAVVAGFVSHEPLLVLLGRRGARAARANGSRAALWLTVTVATTAAAGLAAMWLMPSAVRWSVMLPLAPAAILAATIPGKHDKSAVAEIAAALVFSFVAVPVCLAAGATPRMALVVAIVFALVFVAGTLAVRSLVLAARGGGNPRAAHSNRVTVLLFAIAAGVGLTAIAAQGVVPWTTLLAAAPGLAVASWLALFPPKPIRLRTVGWTLVAAAAAGALLLVLGLPAG